MKNPDIKETKAQLAVNYLAEFEGLIYAATGDGTETKIGTLEQIKFDLVSDGSTIFDAHGCDTCIEITTNYEKSDGDITEIVWKLVKVEICGNFRLDDNLIHEGVWV